MTIEITAIDYHRNGICGDPFYAVLFTDPQMKGHKFMATVFPTKSCAVAVLEIGRLAKGDIAFGSNSWRGDHYADELKAAINETLDPEERI